MLNKQNVDESNLEQEEDVEIDEETQVELETLLLSLDKEFEGASSLVSARRQAADYAQYHYQKVGGLENRLKGLLTQLRKKLVDEDMTFPPSMRTHFHKLTSHPCTSLMRCDRLLLLQTSLEGFDIELKPSEAVAEALKRAELSLELAREQSQRQEVAGSLWMVCERDSPILTLPAVGEAGPEAMVGMHWVRQLQLSVYFLYNYIRKAAKALGAKSVSMLQEKVRAFLEGALKLIVGLLRKASEDGRKVQSDWALLRTLKQLNTLNQQMLAIKSKWDYFWLPLAYLRELAVPDSPSKDEFTAQLLGWLAESVGYLRDKSAGSGYVPFLLGYIRHRSVLTAWLRGFWAEACRNSARLTQAKLIEMGAGVLPPFVGWVRSGQLLFKQCLSDFALLLEWEFAGHGSLISASLSSQPADEMSCRALQQSLKQSYQLQLMHTLVPASSSQAAHCLLNTLLGSLLKVGSLPTPDFQKLANQLLLRMNEGSGEELFMQLESQFWAELKRWNHTFEGGAANFVKSATSSEMNSDLVYHSLVLVRNGVKFLLAGKQSSRSSLGLPPSQDHGTLSRQARCILQLCDQLLLLNPTTQSKNLLLQICEMLLPIATSQLQQTLSHLLQEQRQEILPLRLLARLAEARPQSRAVFLSQFKTRLLQVHSKLQGIQIIQVAEELARLEEGPTLVCQLFSTIFVSNQVEEANQKIIIGGYHQQPVAKLLADLRIARNKQNLDSLRQCQIDGQQNLIVPKGQFYKFSQIQTRTNLLEVANSIDHLLLNASRSEVVGLAALLARVSAVLPSCFAKEAETRPASFLFQVLQKVLYKYPIFFGYVSNSKIALECIRQKVGFQENQVPVGTAMLFLQALAPALGTERVLRMMVTNQEVRFTNLIPYCFQQNRNLLHDAAKALNSRAPCTSSLLLVLTDLVRSNWPFFAQIKKIDQFISRLPHFLSHFVEDKPKASQLRQEVLRLLFKIKQSSQGTQQVYQTYVTSQIRKCVLHQPSKADVEARAQQDKTMTLQKAKFKPSDFWQMRTSALFEYNQNSLVQAQTRPEKLIVEWPADISLQRVKTELAKQPARPSQIKIPEQFKMQKYSQKSQPLSQSLLGHFSAEQLAKLYKTDSQKLLQMVPPELRQDFLEVVSEAGLRVEQQQKADQQRRRVQCLASVWGQNFSLPTLTAQQIDMSFLAFVEHGHPLQLFNQHNFQRYFDLIVLSLLSDEGSATRAGLLQIQAAIKDELGFKQRLVSQLQKIQYFCKLMYLPLEQMQPARTPLGKTLFQSLQQVNAKESPLILVMKHILGKNKKEDNGLLAVLESVFRGFFGALRLESGRRVVLSAEETGAVRFGVGVDTGAMNLLLKFVGRLDWLKECEALIEGNFQNMRLYMEKLGEGLRSMNLAGKIRTYNQFIRLSPRDWNDPQFLAPLQLLRANLKFYVRLLAAQYRRSMLQAKSSSFLRVKQLFDRRAQGESVPNAEFENQLGRLAEQRRSLQTNTLMNYKSIYLCAKLRDLFLQGGKTLQLIIPVLQQSADPNAVIERVQLFTLMCNLHRDLLLFQDSWAAPQKRVSYSHRSANWVSSQIQLSTTRKIGGLSYPVMTRNEIQFDEVMVGFISQAKCFFVHALGAAWASTQSYPLPLLLRSRVRYSPVTAQLPPLPLSPVTVQVDSKDSIESFAREIVKLSPKQLLAQNPMVATVAGEQLNFDQVAELVAEGLKKVMLLESKENGFSFNALKQSQSSVELITALGRAAGHAVVLGKQYQFNLHGSILRQAIGDRLDLDSVCDFDRGVWQHIKQVMNSADSKQLGLTFVYEVANAEGGKQKVSLIPNGVAKKVNNLNRQEYCDAVAALVLCERIKPQLIAFLTGFYAVAPKEHFCNLSQSQVAKCLGNIQKLSLWDAADRRDILQRGIALPERAGSLENTMDQQTIQCFVECLGSDSQRMQEVARSLGLCFERGEGNWTIVTQREGRARKEGGVLVLGHCERAEDVLRGAVL